MGWVEEETQEVLEEEEQEVSHTTMSPTNPMSAAKDLVGSLFSVNAAGDLLQLDEVEIDADIPMPVEYQDSEDALNSAIVDTPSPTAVGQKIQSTNILLSRYVL